MFNRKRIVDGRDLITLLYLGFVFLCIAFYLGGGNITAFFASVKEMFPLEAGVESVRQFWNNIVTEGTLGTTRQGEVYEDIVKEYFPRSLYIIVTAFLLSVTIGIWKGIFDFKHKYTYFNVVGTGLTSFLTSLPDFFLIIALQWVILRNFPFIDVFGHDQWYNFIFPSLLVSLYPMMYFARITFTTLSNEEGEMYVQFARAKGFTQRMVIYKHILRKCFRSILEHLGVVMTYVVSNLLIVEWLMQYKGAAWRMMVSFKRLDTDNPKKPENAVFAGYEEIGLIGEITLCFVALLLITQMISVVWQNKYSVEKQNIWLQLLKVVLKYFVIFILIIVLVLYIHV